ncbi:GldG family protein [Sphingopyxis sp. JAI128]|uniref:GldG family protein n=1 Tax=Sphingopyxis sp. JAI128 TaxID=2723066 RepID=UPI0017995883|nr:GldG family protein [Sphingopyxis sp. JAI128]MBB6425557.1 hypothetical protein [Sphingopyxis sp. JAI128]
MLRAPAIAILIVGAGWSLGGQALLGRIDPALSLPLLAMPMLALAFWQRHESAPIRWQTALLSLTCMAAAQALLAYFLAGSPGWPQLALMVGASALAAFAADRLVQWRPAFRLLPWLAAPLLVAGWFGVGHGLLAFLYRPAVAPAGSPAVTILTGLPLRWSGGSDMAAMIADGTQDDPALARIEAAGPVSLVDSLVEHVPPPGGALLVAHPRALAPRELIAIDTFVRGGGRAVILADALSAWPARHPLGDPRNPPVTSLLTPLLDHWDVVLGAASADEIAPQAADIGESRLRLFSAGRFVRLSQQCRAYAQHSILQCRVGTGEAWLVGDADLLFAPLWQPIIPGAGHLRQADTMEWLAAHLWPGAGQRMFHPLWIRRRAI